MIDLLENTRELLSLIENKYDIIRIINIITKQCKIINKNNVEIYDGTCYHFWQKDDSCSNCISTRAYFEKETIAKIESVKDKVYLVISYPLFSNHEEYIIEIIKDISCNHPLFKDNSISDSDIKVAIDKLNDTIINSEKIDINSTITELNAKLANRDEKNSKLTIDTEAIKKLKFSNLDKQIEALREVLNKMCVSTDTAVHYDKILETSQYLDKLIVEYMKIDSNKNKNKK